MVDDNPTSVREELDEIRDFLERRHGRKLVVDKYETADNLLEKIDHDVDLMFIDKNLKNASGIDAVGDIRKKYKLVDVLVYTRLGMQAEDLIGLYNYSLVEVARNKREILGKFKALIERRMSKWHDVTYLRGVVISRIIELEGEIDDLLMDIFSPPSQTKQRFRDLVLENSLVPLEAKKKILSKIVEQMNPRPFSLTELQKLQEYRNVLAHSRATKNDPNTSPNTGTKMSIDESEIKKIFEMAENFSECVKSFRKSLG